MRIDFIQINNYKLIKHEKPISDLAFLQVGVHGVHVEHAASHAAVELVPGPDHVSTVADQFPMPIAQDQPLKETFV